MIKATMYGRQKDTGMVTPCRAKDPSTCPYHAEGSHVQMTSAEAESFNEKVAESNASKRTLSKESSDRNVVAAVMDSTMSAEDVYRVRESLSAMREINTMDASGWLSRNFSRAALDMKTEYNRDVREGAAPAGLHRLMTTASIQEGGRGDSRESTIIVNMGPSNPLAPADPKTEGGFVSSTISERLYDMESEFADANPSMRLAISGSAEQLDERRYAQKVLVTPSKPGEVAQGAMLEYAHITGHRPLYRFEKTPEPGDDESTRLSMLDRTDPSGDVLIIVDSLDDGSRAIRVSKHRHSDDPSEVKTLFTHWSGFELSRLDDPSSEENRFAGNSELYRSGSSSDVETLESSGDEAHDIWETARKIDSMIRELKA